MHGGLRPGLFDVKDQPLEVFPFGVVNAHRMVGRLCELMENTDLPAAEGGTTEHRFPESVACDGLRTGKGEEQAPGRISSMALALIRL